MEVWTYFVGGAAVSAFLMAILTASLGALYSMAIKRIDFNNDFYKRIISKRIGAIEEIEKSLRPMMLVSESDDKKLFYQFFLPGIEDEKGDQITVNTRFANFNIAYTYNSVWLSQEVLDLSESLVLLSRKILEDHDVMSAQIRGEYEMSVYLGQGYSRELKVLLEPLYSALQEDYVGALDVEGFLDSKGISQTTLSRLASMLKVDLKPKRT